MTAPLFLTCIKTGTFWPVSGEREAMKLARLHGLVDFEIGPAQ